MDRWTDRRMYGCTDSPCSTGLHLLWFLPGPLPCSHNCYHYKIPEQGKGTDDHLLHLGDWLTVLHSSFHMIGQHLHPYHPQLNAPLIHDEKISTASASTTLLSRQLWPRVFVCVCVCACVCVCVCARAREYENKPLFYNVILSIIYLGDMQLKFDC